MMPSRVRVATEPTPVGTMESGALGPVLVQKESTMDLNPQRSEAFELIDTISLDKAMPQAVRDRCSAFVIRFFDHLEFTERWDAYDDLLKAFELLEDVPQHPDVPPDTKQRLLDRIAVYAQTLDAAHAEWEQQQKRIRQERQMEAAACAPF